MKTVILNVSMYCILLNLQAQVPNSWTQKANFGGTPRTNATGFSIGNKGYIGTGGDGTLKNDFWEYDPSINVWTQKANFGGTARRCATGFSIGNKGYIGTGYDGTYKNDFWEYDPASNTWVQKAGFGGSPRMEAVGFSIGSKGYVGTGGSGAILNDFWEYDPVTNAWTQKANFGGAVRFLAAGFSIGNKGYIGTGVGLTFYDDLWEYNPSTNVWTQKSSLWTAIPRNNAVGFSIGNKGYIGTGHDTTGYWQKDFWEYNVSANSWSQRANFGGYQREEATGFSISGKGYIGTGRSGINYNDFWEYTPVCSAPVAVIYASGNLTFCIGDSVFLYANNGCNYQWKKNGVDITGATSYYYSAKVAGSYTCYLTNSCGAVNSTAISVTVNSLPSATITPSGATTFCSGGSVVLNALTGANKTYQWKKNNAAISGATSSSYTATASGNYKVTVTNIQTGCSKTTAVATVVTVNSKPASTITPQGPTTFCAGGSVVLSANTGTGLTYKWKKGSNFISGATLSNYTATTGGNYKVQVTNSNGCSNTSAGVVVSVPCREGEITSLKNNLDFSVYPNPNSGEFTIKFSNQPISHIQIELTDGLGKVVKSFETSDETVVIKESNLAKGIYCLTARNKDKEVVRKINVVK